MTTPGDYCMTADSKPRGASRRPVMHGSSVADMGIEDRR